MIDPRASAHGNLNEKRIDLMLIAGLVERGTRVLDIGCGNGELMELLVAERDVDARGLPPRLSCRSRPMREYCLNYIYVAASGP